MKPLRIVLLSCFLCLALAQSHPALGQAALWQNLAAGIDYREFYLPTPNHVYVARMERDNPQVTIESSIAQGRVSGGLETVRGQAERYEQAINYWDGQWGARNQIVVAINGSFFNTQTGVPWSGLVYSGWYAKRFEDRETASGFAWTMDRQAFIGGCVAHRPNKQLVKLLALNESIPFDGINLPRGDDELIIYTPQYGPSTPQQEDSLEALVELNRPMLIAAENGTVTGVVRQVQEGKGATPLPFDHIVLSAGGKAYTLLKDALKEGDKVTISQELRHWMPDCRTPNPQSWERTYASVSGSYLFLKDGEIRPLTDLGAVLRNPRTAVAFDDRYIYFIVVDGRNQLESLGTSMVELAQFAKQTLGARWGMALDGGGSSTMVINGVVRNHPNAETVVRARSDRLERDVANGLMMVVVQPRQQSSRFQPGQRVDVAPGGDANLRLGPGTNYYPLTTLPPASQGVVVQHPLNGVLATGYSWWKVAFGDAVGWMSESVIEQADSR